MTDTDRDAQTIREALESAFGDWEAGLAALERLVAALSAATTDRDEALADRDGARRGEDEAWEKWQVAERRAEALAAQLQQAREALQGLLDAAEAEVGPKLGEPDKNAEYWAALDPDKHVPGVARRVALAHAVIVVRAALAAAAPATTLIEYECDHGGRFYARYANGEVLPTGVTIRAFAGKSHITPKRYAEIIPAAGAAPNETEQCQ